MKKRLLAILVAATMVMTSAAGVFAAGSAGKGVQAVENETTSTDNYYVATAGLTETASFVALQSTAPEATKLIEEVLAGETSGADFLAAVAAQDGVSEEVKAAVADKEMLTQPFDLDKVGEPEKVDGKYRVTLKIQGLTDKTTGLGILHLTSAGVWEFIPAVEGSIDLANKTASFDFDSFSPVIVVADAGTIDTGAAEDTADDEAKSPKTSQTSDWMTWALMAVVLAAGAAALRRKAN